MTDKTKSQLRAEEKLRKLQLREEALERLRTSWARLVDTFACAIIGDEMTSEIDDLKAENAKLRKVLRALGVEVDE